MKEASTCFTVNGCFVVFVVVFFGAIFLAAGFFFTNRNLVVEGAVGVARYSVVASSTAVASGCSDLVLH
jgi:hypothetical protein